MPGLRLGEQVSRLPLLRMQDEGASQEGKDVKDKNGCEILVGDCVRGAGRLMPADCSGVVSSYEEGSVVFITLMPESVGGENVAPRIFVEKADPADVEVVATVDKRILEAGRLRGFWCERDADSGSPPQEPGVVRAVDSGDEPRAPDEILERQEPKADGTGAVIDFDSAGPPAEEPPPAEVQVDEPPPAEDPVPSDEPPVEEPPPAEPPVEEPLPDEAPQ